MLNAVRKNALKVEKALRETSAKSLSYIETSDTSSHA